MHCLENVLLSLLIDLPTVRLVNGDNDYEGRVEIFLNSVWGTIDDDPWDNNDASVVCRQLGYTFGGVAHESAHFGQGSGPIWLDKIECIGNEDNLLSCFHQNDTSEDSHSKDVGVACNGKGKHSETKVRLAGGKGPDEGRVEIFKNGQWGTVDDDHWNDIDAEVVCRELGYLHGGAAFRFGYFGQGTGPIWLDNINCVGNEPHLMNCPHETDTSEDNHSEDVGVRCAWKGIFSLLRLVDGSLPCEGRVEVLINNRWGTIKDDNWDNREANVVCSQLGYASGGIAYSGAYFGEGKGPVLVENFKCAGTESSLFSCSHREISLDGGHSKDAGVACFDLSNDFCSSQPCANNGKCVNARTSFLCFCPTGFNGTRCENVIDPCDSSPCEHNGTCIRERNYFHCICPDGVVGPQCEVEINPCFSNPFQGRENCSRQGNNFEYVTVETPNVINIEIIISTILLTLALCILLVEAICLIKINKMKRAIKQLVLPPTATMDGDHVQMRFQRSQYTTHVGCVIGCDNEGHVISKQNSSSESLSDDDLEVYENFQRR
ncbi:Neurotrypsin [Holothuria leucospilota]|uniref:Neurotrypsin n=1 Tax=Holothuria leucospilota TaxID=206669 RepID=A0A9Q1BZF9_HOLLE|nr:Neurotrypsin [Holothuria leucospilota]